MGKALQLICSSSVATHANGVFGSPLHCNWGSSTTDANNLLVIRTPGVMSLLGYKVNNQGTSRNLKVRKNGANGNGVATATDSTAGIYEDNTNTDSYSAGDTFNLAYTQSGSTASHYWWRTVFTANSGHACIYSTQASSNSVTNGVTSYFPIGGAVLPSTTTEANLQAKVRVAGNHKNLCIIISGNTLSGGNAVARNRINTANGTLAATITASTTGTFEDTSHSDALASGDIVNLVVDTTAASLGSCTVQLFATTIEASSTANDIITGATNTRAASATTHYVVACGQSSFSNTVETDAVFRHGFAVTASKMRWYVSANTYSATVTPKLRVNSADGNQTISITNATTGWFEDSTNSDTLAATDDICYSITGGTSGTLTVRQMMLTDTPQGSSTLTADVASYTLTGKASLFQTQMPETKGTYTLTGIAAALRDQRNMAAATASYTLTGKDALFQTKMAEAAAAYVLTGKNSVFQVQMVEDTVAYTLEGLDVLFQYAAILSAAAASFSLTGNATLFEVEMPTTVSAYTLNGIAVAMSVTFRPPYQFFLLL